MSLEGWKEKASRRFLDSVNASRQVPFERVLFALGIRFVGETTARDIARHFGNIDAVKEATREQLLTVPEVGEVIADSILAFFKDADNLAEVEALKAAGLRMSTEASSAPVAGPLADKVIVISGNFSISRDEMKALIEANGGRNSGSVSGKTDYLLAGSKPGPEKIKKAGELGISIIDEAQFRELIGTHEAAASPSPLQAIDPEPTLF